MLEDVKGRPDFSWKKKPCDTMATWKGSIRLLEPRCSEPGSSRSCSA